MTTTPTADGIPTHCAYDRLVPVSKLKPNPHNPNRHPKAQLDIFCKVVLALGWRAPIMVSSRSWFIVKGHARLEVARMLNAKRVPVDFQEYATEAEEWQDLLADNRISELSARDDEEVAHLLKELGADVVTGYDDKSRKKLLDLLNSKEAEKVPDAKDHSEIQRKWATAAGQLWILGEHRLLCGSSTESADVARLLENRKPHLMVTDPPYGVNYDPTWREKAGIGSTSRIGTVLNDDIADWSKAWELFPGNVAYVWHGALHAQTVSESLQRTGFQIRAQIIWAKSRLVIGRGNYHWQHEPCWYAVREGRTAHWNGDRDKTTLWRIVDDPEQSSSTLWDIPSGDQDADTMHSTQKPLECMRRPILNNSLQGDYVYEPFNGSGTTLIACAQLERRCLAMELNPIYIAVALERWHKLTAQTPHLA